MATAKRIRDFSLNIVIFPFDKYPTGDNFRVELEKKINDKFMSQLIARARLKIRHNDTVNNNDLTVIVWVRGEVGAFDSIALTGFGNGPTVMKYDHPYETLTTRNAEILMVEIPIDVKNYFVNEMTPRPEVKNYRKKKGWCEIE